MTVSIPDRVQLCIKRFDAANSDDPNKDPNGLPKELVYARRMTAWLEKLAPDAPVEVRLAVRAQHIRRWEIPRSTYPVGRSAYLEWRKDLGRFHAETAGAIMHECGFDSATITTVQGIIRKERFKVDPWAQLLEDVACLVFLEFYFESFASQQDEESMIHILRRTWRKMSDSGREAARTIQYSPGCADLLGAALESR